MEKWRSTLQPANLSAPDDTKVVPTAPRLVATILVALDGVQ